MQHILRAAFGIAGLAALALFAPVTQAGTLEVVDGTAVFTSAPREVNDVRAGVSATGNNLLMPVKFIDSGAPLTAGTGCEQLDASSAWCPGLSSDSPFLIWVGDGDDRVDVRDPAPREDVTIHGGSGRDVLAVGNGVSSSPALYGGSGEDTLSANMNSGGTPLMRGGPGGDALNLIGDGGGGLLYGERGDDHLFNRGLNFGGPVRLEGGVGDDRYSFGFGWRWDVGALVAGPGIDTLDLSSRSLGVRIDLADCLGCVEHIVGSASDDEITGAAVRELILGGDGNDVLNGGGGRDVIAGQEGDDTITSRDDVFDAVSCEGGTDAVIADLFDLIGADCETVSRVAAPQL
jgi:Ca2+-binding RTX toxin-like protein